MSDATDTRPTRSVTLTILIMSLAGATHSYEDKAIAGIINMPLYAYHLCGDSTLPSSWLSLIAPIPALGQAAGGFLAGWLCDRFGRKMAVLIGCAAGVVSVAGMTWSPGIGIIIAARVLQGKMKKETPSPAENATMPGVKGGGGDEGHEKKRCELIGISVGLLLSGNQLYVSETASAKSRASMSTIITITNKTFGLLAAIITFAVTYVDRDWGWRFTIALTLFPLVILTAYLPFIPESPRWLYSNGQNTKAQNVLTEFHGPKQGQVLYEDLKSQFDKDTEHTSYLDLVRTRENRWRTFLTVTFAIWGTFTGHNFWKYYFTAAYNAAGVTDHHVQFGLQLMHCGLNIIAGVSGAYYVRRMSRRSLMFQALGVTLVSLIIQAALSRMYLDKGDKRTGAGITFLALYYLSRNFWIFAWNPIATLYATELWPTELRSKGFAVSNAVIMLATYLAQVSALPTYESCQGWTFAIYAAVMVVALITIWAYYPETQGLTLEEVQLRIDESCQKTTTHSNTSATEKASPKQRGRLTNIELADVEKKE